MRIAIQKVGLPARVDYVFVARAIKSSQFRLTVTEFRGSHGMEEGKGEIYLASGRQYGNALLGVRHQEEEVAIDTILSFVCLSV